MNIYALTIAQLIRTGLRLLAAYLFLGNVLPAEMQNTLIETVVTDVTPAIILAITESWSNLQKRYFPKLLQAAIEVSPTASVDHVKRVAADRSNAPVVY